jgi:hypothetical protein
LRPVTAAFLDTLRGSNSTAYRATVTSTFQTGVTPTGTQVSVVGGSVTIAGDADLRSSLDLTVDGTRAWPRFAADPLAPYGNEVYVEVGVVHSSAVEWVGLGYHRIRTISQDDVPDGPIRIEGEDRMAALRDARLLTPRQFAPGTTLGSVMSTLVNEVYPAAAIEWDDTTESATLTRRVEVEESRHGFLRELVEAHGKIWYWDHRGVLVIKDLPDPTRPVYEISSGRRGVLVSMRRHLTRDGTYNAVVASGEGASTQAPVSATAINANPASPTYFYGPFGQVPRFFSSALLATSAQAAQAAQTLLLRQLGLPYAVQLGTVSNPALEPHDPIQVHYGPNDAPEVHVIERLTIPLTESAAMTADTKEQTVTLIGTL